MSRLNRFFLVLTALACFCFVVQAVNAQTVIVGPNNDLSRYPIGMDPTSASSAFPDFAAGGIYQQVYAASAFSGPITITKIAFASSSSLTSGPGIATYNFNLGLSTTAVGPNNISTNFAANRGADFAQVFSGPLTATITRSDQFDLIIDITPFTYNPANGNLLLDVTMNSPTLFSGGATLYYRAGNSSTISRAANPANTPGGAFVTQGFGLQTRFSAQSNTAPDAIDDAVIIDEDSGANSINVLANDSDHENDALTITAITQGLHGAVAISAGGAGLTYTPVADYFGPDTFTYTISDGHGGSDTANVNVTVNAVNDPPSFTKGADQVVNEDAGAQTLNAWATNVSAGPANESGQTVNFSVTNDRNDLFATQPSINAAGLLTYNSAPNAFGVATVAVTLHDDGGTANGGQDSSGAQTFTITIKPIADFPSVTNATTSVNAQTNSGLVIDRNPVDGAEVTHFKITSITNGRLFQHDGTTEIVNGGVITFVEGQAGLKFTPDANLFSPASSFFFTVQAGTGDSDESFSPAFVTAGIDVGCPSSDLVVTNSNDSGAGSLRDALASACPGSTVTFDMTPGHVTSPITLTGGEILIDRDVTITGPALENLIISGNDSRRVFDISLGHRVAISSLTITGGKADSGAAIRSQGNLLISNSTFAGNHTTGEGSGGALEISGGSLFMINSTISGNAADGDGGGLHNQSAIATLINVTISNNRADSNNDGSGNGGGIFQASSQLILRNTLVAGNFKGNGAASNDVGVLQIAEPFASTSSNNLIGLDDGSSGLLPNINLLGSVANPIDALLGPLVDNGGATATHLLLPGSPAIKAGINSLDGGNQTVLARDQRGFDRVVSGPIDIGAVEVSYAISAVSGTPQSAIIGNAFASPLQATVTESGSGRPGIPLTFTAPTSGASGTFSASATVVTNIEGLAIAPQFTANSIAGGPYNVTASLSGGLPSAAFALTNTIGTAQVTLGNLVQTFDGLPKSVSVLSDPAGLNLVVTYDGSAVAPANAGNYAVRAIVNDANFNGQADAVLVIQPASQLITFDALVDKKLGVGDFNVSATASSGLPVTFTALGNCTVTGAQVHLIGAGACTISAKQDGNSNVNATSVARTFSISKADQQITFAALPDKKFDDADFNVTATSSSNLAVSFTAAGNCTVNGSLVHLSGAGICTITASQDGNVDVNAATPVAHTFSVGKAGQTISFAALANKGFGDADFNVTATASSNLAVSFSATGDCSIAGAQVHIARAGNCTITASQVGDANFEAATPVARQLAVAKADQQITFAAPADKTFGDADFSVSAIASSNLAVSFSVAGNCTVTGTQVHLKGAGLCTITASQDGDANINAANPVARTFSIGKADQQINFAALVDKKFGDADFVVAATASSSLQVSFAANGNCTLTGAQVHLGGAGACTINAAQEGNSDYNPATAIARTFAIGKADQQITFEVLADKKFGDADAEVTASASSHLVVTFAATGNCILTGSHVHLNGAGACTITASQEGNENINAATSVARTFSIGKSDQQVTFAVLPDKTFGDADIALDATASSNLAVSFAVLGKCSLTGNQVHLTGAGICTVTASQNGNADYDAATNVIRAFAIGKADQQITFGALPDRTVGDADFNISATASSDLTVVFAAVGSCTLSGTQVHLAEAGSCTVTALQAGNADYNPAVDVARTFTIADQANSQPVFSFGSEVYEVSEGAGSMIIQVKRDGDTSGAATVDYSSDDEGASPDCANFNGFASSRCDFNMTLGTLKFAPGETLKTFDVLINRDSYIEAPFETFTVKLSNPTGAATLGLTATATVKIDDRNDGSPDALANIIDRTPAFVRQQYHDFLNREPDPAGLAFWVDNIDQCDDPTRRPADQTAVQCKEVMRVNTSAAFFLSIEWSQTGGLVRAFYTLALDRPRQLPAFQEFIRDAQEVGRGVIVGEGDWQRQLNDNREAFTKDFVTRPEFVELYPTVDSPAIYVNKLYLHAFGRNATAAELADGVGEFGGSATAADPSARAHALLRLTAAPDFARETTIAFVQMQYLGYLRRNANDPPDSGFAGFDFWVTKLNRFNGDFINAEMVKAFLESREYRARFGP